MPRSKALFVSKNLIGDSLYIGPALKQWHREHPHFEIDILTNQDHVTCIYERMGVPVRVLTCSIPEAMENSEYQMFHTFDVSDAFSYCDKHKAHIAEGYAAQLGVTLPVKPERVHLRPIFFPTPEPITEEEKGKVLISMFSASCTSQDKNNPGMPPNKMLPWDKWLPIILFLKGWFGENSTRFLGSQSDRAPLPISEDEYWTGIPLNKLALLMKESKCVVTLDNGMSHLAASQCANEILFYPACLGVHFIVPAGNPNLGVMQINPVLVKPAEIILEMKKMFHALNLPPV